VFINKVHNDYRKLTKISATFCRILVSAVLAWPLVKNVGLAETGPTEGSSVDRPGNEGISSFTLLESGQVQPITLSPSGKYLYAVNTPDSKLAIVRVDSQGLKPVGSVSVGLEPVAVAARSEKKVWVVNHIRGANGSSATSACLETVRAQATSLPIAFAAPPPSTTSRQWWDLMTPTTLII